MIKPAFAAGMVLLVAAIFGRSTGITITGSPLPGNYERVQKGVISDTEETVRKLIGSLHDPNLSADAQSQLIAISRSSQVSRARVIRLLISDAESQSELDGRHVILSSEIFDYWFRAGQVFSELKATESVDLLIRNIYAGNGLTGSLGYRPAFSALVGIGTPAVPKLADALLNSNDEMARSSLAICLGTIGGRGAERALTRALKKESSKDVTRYINRGLAMIRGDQSSTDLVTLP